MKTILLALVSLTLTVSAVESVTEIFVGFINTNGVAVCGPLKDFQPKPVKSIRPTIITTNTPSIKK